MDYDTPKTYQGIAELLKPLREEVQTISAQELAKIRGRSTLERMLAQSATIRTTPAEQETANTYWKKSEDAYKKGDIQASKSDLQKAIELDPTNSGYYNLLGVLHAVEGNDFEAVRMYKKAIELNNGLNPITFYNLAKSLKFGAMKEVSNNNYAEAKRLFEESKRTYGLFLQVGTTDRERTASENSIRSIEKALAELPL